MEPEIFLGRPQSKKELRILSWNINGCKTKLEKTYVQSLLQNFDIIGLNEVKTGLPVSFPGYVSYQSVAKRSASHRGGTVVLVKNCLANAVVRVDTSIEDQVWLKFHCMPHTLFGFCYVPPSDSEYYTNASFASVMEKLKNSDIMDSYIIIGDLNARFGSSSRDIPSLAELPNYSTLYKYPYIPDPVQHPNDNANILASICMETKMVVLNNLQYQGQHYKSDKTFRKGTDWVSELDTCVVSPKLLTNMQDLSVLKDLQLPSDHAPLAITMLLSHIELEKLKERANSLGGHAVLNVCSNKNECVQPINMQCVDIELLQRNFQSAPVDGIVNGTIDEQVTELTEVLYKCVKSAKCGTRQVEVRHDRSLSRWERMLNNKDDLAIWKAVNWKGEYSQDELHDDKPSDLDFKMFIENTQNSPNNSQLPMNHISTNVYTVYQYWMS